MEDPLLGSILLSPGHGSGPARAPSPPHDLPTTSLSSEVGS
jgi:hypothetical protein